MAEDATLYSWNDGGLNSVAVRRAGPVYVLVEARHGPSTNVVRLHHSQVVEMASALSAYVEATEPLAVVEQVLRRNTLPAASAGRTAVWIVEALRAQGFLPTEGESQST